jgi:lambda family phage portal protein
MVEVDELDSDTMTPHNSGNKVVGGIEYNKWNKPVGYFIRQYDLDGFTITEPIWVKADDVIFYFSKKRPSQIREMSDMAPTITRIRDVNEFMMSISVKQRIEACLSVFIKKSIPTGGIGRSGAGAASAERTSYDGKMLSPGMIKELNAGDEVQVVNPSGQAADATSFTKLQQRLIGAGQGISYEAMSRDMSESNYSSARQGIIEDDLTCSAERELLAEVMDEIYETFVISAVLAGKLDIPKFWEEGEKERYLSHDWIKAPKPWIDPVKESTANRTALETGQKTFKEIAGENGKDWRQQLDDMAEVIEYASGLGIDLTSILFGQKTLEVIEQGEQQE